MTKPEQLDPPRRQPDFEMADDMADFAVDHPAINRKIANVEGNDERH